MLVKLLAVITAALVPVSLLASEKGGGSSTGGGHVRVCLTPKAAAKAKAIVAEGLLVPQISGNPFEGLKSEDILSVDLIDLIERPDLLPQIKPVFAKIATGTHKQRDYAPDINPHAKANESIKMIQQGSEELRPLVYATRAPEWASDSTPLPEYMLRVTSNSTWTPSPSGLRLTTDFDPRLKLNENCLFAQAVRQTVFTRHFLSFDYDSLLLSKMSDDALLALGLHEQFYAVVMLAPNYNRIAEPSILTRRMTQLALETIAHRPNAQAQLSEIVRRLGYGPFENLVNDDSKTKGKK